MTSNSSIGCSLLLSVAAAGLQMSQNCFLKDHVAQLYRREKPVPSGMRRRHLDILRTRRLPQACATLRPDCLLPDKQSRRRASTCEVKRADIPSCRRAIR